MPNLKKKQKLTHKTKSLQMLPGAFKAASKVSHIDLHVTSSLSARDNKRLGSPHFFFYFFFFLRAFAAGVTSARLSGDQPISAWLRCAAPQSDTDRRGRFPLPPAMKDYNSFAFAG